MITLTMVLLQYVVVTGIVYVVVGGVVVGGVVVIGGLVVEVCDVVVDVDVVEHSFNFCAEVVVVAVSQRPTFSNIAASPKRTERERQRAIISEEVDR